ncbi:hypothetical protein EJ04DRAFT_483843 [Polyplosphaeria fusca]|uniref:Uncharacterized protein n=1 Tax=Polyplosphaeria fusca TaxID=682080 RepID=A0A9P4R9I7_9PLEO|nr:hypothetical protein EJ04DRAFT_483843 [Polyplosphaeria fusca]
MNESPKKHRGTFRPLNTLCSPQKPDFKKPFYQLHLIDPDDSSLSPTSNPCDVEDLGNSRLLFEDEQQHRETTPQSKRLEDMVREREPPGAVPDAPHAQPRTEAPVAAKALQDLKNTSPEFGKTSPLKNPLKKTVQKDQYAHLFNVPKPGEKRVEHHRPSQPPVPAAGPPAASNDLVEISASQFQPRHPPQGMSMPRPFNPPLQTIRAAPPAVYNSMDPPAFGTFFGQGFQPVNPAQAPRQTILLDDEDNFDPDAALRAEGDRFGAPDLYAYVDQSKANENLKELLEGAFDDDEEKLPRTRGRKKKKQQEEEDASNSLARKLKALEVKNKEEDDASAGEDEDEDEDDGTVDGLEVKLLPHQVDGVAWMIEKETGAHHKRGKLPKGGILADDMGLGKTIQSIALLLSNPRPDKNGQLEHPKNKITPVVTKGTLIVAPLALIKQWEAEIKDKVSPSHGMKVLVHHGPNRTKSSATLKNYDVVITTYQVLASEHASGEAGPDGLKKGCFALHWYRAILDEAHTIKNRNAKMTKACYDVRAHYRWCLTGTPMQNNLDELQSLIKFLRIQPYSDMSSWKNSITGPMKNGRGNLAMRRLQIFLKAFMKRRTKDVLKKEGALNFGGKSKDGKENGGFQIVARNVETVIGEFTAKERAFYDRLSNRAESRLAEMMGAAKTDYIGALVLLLRLRQACNHPNLTKSNVKDDKDALTTGSKNGVGEKGTQTPRKGQEVDMDDLVGLLGEMSVQAKRCDICQVALTKYNTATGPSTAGAIRCNNCEDDLNASQKKSKKHKKHRKHKHKHKHTDQIPKASKPARQRRVVVDSDDEDQGEWLVPEDEQNAPDLGKAGGLEDEDAEGGGDTLGSVDSNSFVSDDEGTPSKKKEMGSFIVHDTDSEDEGPVARQRPKKNKVINLVSEDDAATGSESDSEETHSETDSEESDSGESNIEYDASDLTPSTKIRQLLSILEKETPDHKVIVFSQFTSMLDLVEPFLDRDGFNFTRYDGKMRNDLREASLHKLRNDKHTRVLLCSLKCGSLGLNLTAASRVVIMEPFWNPFVEEQAIDRVHRLNQTVDVTVYRLSIHNSVEERILDLQEAKRKLADAALEGGKAVSKLSMKDILALFKHDAEFDHRNVDDGADATIFARTRVLDVGGGETTEPVRRKAEKLGFKRSEDSVYGRR